MTFDIISDSTIVVVEGSEKFGSKRYDINKTPTNTVTCSCYTYRGSGYCKHLEFLKEQGINLRPKRLGKDPFTWLKKYEVQIESKVGEKWLK